MINHFDPPCKRETTFEEALKNNGHENADIAYVKLDVEKNEMSLLPAWIESGVLRRVAQIGVEFHRVPNFIGSYADIIKALYKDGFRIISWDPNLHFPAGKQGYFSFFEVLFRRPK